MDAANRGHVISRRDVTRLLATVAAIVGGAVVPMHGADAAHGKKGVLNMTQDLATLAAEHFEPLIGETFTIGDYQVTLRDVRRQKFRSRFREQFSITFNAPRDLPIRSERLPVTHPAIGRHELLVTQVLDAADGTALEICFS